MRTVDWKKTLDFLPPGYPAEEENTLYVANDTMFVRWAFDHNRSGVGSELLKLVKRGKGTWNSLTGWNTDAELAKVLTRMASEAGWRIASASEVLSPPLLPLEIVQCGADAWMITTSVDRWKDLVNQHKGQLLQRALWRLASSTDYLWVHSQSRTDLLMSVPMRYEVLRKVQQNISTLAELEIVKRQSDEEVQAWRAAPVRVSGGTIVKVTVDGDNPLHWVVLGPQLRGVKRGQNVGATLSLPRKDWEDMAAIFTEMGGSIDEASQETAIVKPSLTDIPGWDRPIDGKMLFTFQKEGIEFLIGRSMRAILGDEMGLGKTAQVICAALGARARRILVIVPANARYVWERELRSWAGQDVKFVHIKEALSDDPLPDGGWIITTYDALTPRAENWKPATPDEAAAYLEALATRGGASTDIPSSLPQVASDTAIFRFDPRVDKDLAEFLKTVKLRSLGLDGRCLNEATEQLRRIGRRVSAEIVKRLDDWDPDLIVVDEAHRIKNHKAARTEVVRSFIADDNRGALLLTGTPLRNHAGEGAALVDAIFPGAARQLLHHRLRGRMRRFDENARSLAVHDLLKEVMIRRLKSNVLDLPPVIREYYEVDPSGVSYEEYVDVLDSARATLRESIAGGLTISQARKQIIGMLARARRLLGLAKVNDGQVADLIDAIVDEKQSCLVFVEHRAVSDLLVKQLMRLRRSFVCVDGRTSQTARREAEERFQAGDTEVFIGGINSAAEAITLTRADTSVFVELDYVPAAMHQAEARGHRAGQTSDTYRVISLIARTPGELSLDQEIVAMLNEKLADINQTLSEEAQLIGKGAAEEGFALRVAKRLID